jgi:hypothetical protein
MEFWPLFKQKSPDIRRMEEEHNIKGLIRALGHQDLETQWKAAEALSSMGDVSVPFLIRSLGQRGKDIRLGAIEALGKIGDPRAVDPLLALLDEKSNEIRWEATLALGEIGDSRAIPALVAALRDADRHVRYGAALSLSQLGWIPENAEDKAFLSLGMMEWNLLVQQGQAAITALALAVTDRDASVRKEAVDVLGAIGDKGAIPALTRALQDKEEEVRWRAVLAAPRCGMEPVFIPRWLSKRPTERKNPLIAGFLNFILPGMGYFYLGKWWGILIFQVDVTATLWIFAFQGRDISYTVMFPIYLFLGIHAWYIAMQMPDL